MALACFITAPVGIIAQHTTTFFKELKDIPADKAAVYIYRISTYDAGVHYNINANDKPVMTSDLYIGTYMVCLADPGKLELSAQMGKHRGAVSLNVDAGKSYFVEASIKSDAWTSKPCFTPIPKETALKTIRRCRLLVDPPLREK